MLNRLVTAIASLTARQGSQEYITNDLFFGFNKIIVLYTEPGVLVAMDTLERHILWRRYIGKEQKVICLRDHPVVGGGPELLVLGLNGYFQGVYIDADDGKMVDQIPFTKDAIDAFILPYHHRLPEKTKNYTPQQRIVVIIKQNHELVLYPKMDATYAEFEKYRDDLVYYSREDGNNGSHSAIVGRRIVPLADKAPYQKYAAVPSWSYMVRNDEEIVAESMYPKSRSDSPVRIVGDGSLLIKYLNPNLLALALLHRNASHTVEESEKRNDINNESVLRIVLLDSHTGRLLFSNYHTCARKPIHLVQHEYSIAYSFYNMKLLRTELHMLHLYDGAIGPKSLNLWKRPKTLSSASKSTYLSKLPVVLQVGYISPIGITSLSYTKTAQGITPVHLLLGTETGGVYKLDLRYIDPRNPHRKPTSEEEEERLIEYMPWLPLLNDPRQMLTYNQTVFGLHTIETTSSNLESTSLCFAYGVDLFYTRIMPAGGFDLLPFEFNRPLLVVLLGVLMIATMFLRRVIVRKRLYEAWK